MRSQQFHFHAPSEHKVSGNNFPLECTSCIRTTRRISAVLGVSLCAKAPRIRRSIPFGKRLPAKAGPEQTIAGQRASTWQALRAGVTRVLRVPRLAHHAAVLGEREVVVLAQTGTVSAAQVANSRALFGHNNRPDPAAKPALVPRKRGLTRRNRSPSSRGRIRSCPATAAARTNDAHKDEGGTVTKPRRRRLLRRRAENDRRDDAAEGNARHGYPERGAAVGDRRDLGDDRREHRHGDDRRGDAERRKGDRERTRLSIPAIATWSMRRSQGPRSPAIHARRCCGPARREPRRERAGQREQRHLDDPGVANTVPAAARDKARAFMEVRRQPNHRERADPIGRETTDDHAGHRAVEDDQLAAEGAGSCADRSPFVSMVPRARAARPRARRNSMPSSASPKCRRRRASRRMRCAGSRDAAAADPSGTPCLNDGSRGRPPPRPGYHRYAAWSAAGSAGPSPAPSNTRLPKNAASPTGASSGSCAAVHTSASPASSHFDETRSPSRPATSAVRRTKRRSWLPAPRRPRRQMQLAHDRIWRPTRTRLCPQN